MFDLSQIITLATEAANEAMAAEAESGGIAGQFGINWKLFIAQLVNFGVIVLILWKWVFNPVIGALQNRQQKIEKSLVDAEKVRKQVEELTKSRQEHERAAKIEYEQIVARATDAANAQKQEILNAAKQRAEKIMKETEARIAHAEARMILEVREELADLAIAAAEKLIAVRLNQSADKELVRKVIGHVEV